MIDRSKALSAARYALLCPMTQRRCVAGGREAASSGSEDARNSINIYINYGLLADILQQVSCARVENPSG
jgi:hypothetical protein